MDDLSLFMLDIVENSFNAHATTVTVTLSDSIHENRLSLEIVDNGIGMDQTTLEKVTNPFYTTRTTRKVGLGIPFFRDSALQTGGDFAIESTPNVGTKIKAIYVLNHIDTPPLGDIAQTIQAILVDPRMERFVFDFITDVDTFHFDTDEVRAILGDVPLTDVGILGYLKEYIHTSIRTIRGGAI